MILGLPAFVTTAGQDAEKAGQYALTTGEKVFDVTSLPEEDLAADIGVDFIWLTGLLVTLKMLGIGLYNEFKR
jgi:hypothetical protein